MNKVQETAQYAEDTSVSEPGSYGSSRPKKELVRNFLGRCSKRAKKKAHAKKCAKQRRTKG